MSNHPLGAVCATRTDPFRVLEEIKRLTLERLGGLPGTLYGPIEDALALSALHVDRDAFQYEDQAALWSLRHQQAAQVMRFRQQLAKGFDEFRTLRAPGRNYLTMGLLDESQLDLHIAGERMAEALAHRGPDGYGFHAEPGIALAHARLSIIDLKTGAQPIHNERQATWTVFNGEIFNYIELRDAETLMPSDDVRRPRRMLAAAWLDGVRLIDNIPV